MPAAEQNVPVSFEVVLAPGLPPSSAATAENEEKAEEFPDRAACRVEALWKRFEALWIWVMLV